MHAICMCAGLLCTASLGKTGCQLATPIALSAVVRMAGSMNAGLLWHSPPWGQHLSAHFTLLHHMQGLSGHALLVRIRGLFDCYSVPFLRQ